MEKENKKNSPAAESGVGGSSSNSVHVSQDISRMPECPPRSTGHRRAHSEIVGLPDDITFDSDLGIVGSSNSSVLSDETEEDVISMYIDMEKFGSCSTNSGSALPEDETPVSASVVQGESNSSRPRARHQHSQSMDGSTSVKPEMLGNLNFEGLLPSEAKKALSAQKLADLALVDPKRAKRIWANRQSAARSKERKMRYIAELEKRVQALQKEATTLSAQLAMLQRDTTSLTAENSELRLRLQTMEQQTNLQNALNDALREEVQRLRIATGTAVQSSGQTTNFRASLFGSSEQYYNYNHTMQSVLTAHQLQQLQLHSQQNQQSHAQSQMNQQSNNQKNKVSVSQAQDQSSSSSTSMK